MPGSVIGTSLLNGYPGTFAREGDRYIRNRLVRSTDTASISFGDPVVTNSDGTYSRFQNSASTLTAALVSATQYTALAVVALTAPVDAGDDILIGSGGTTQIVTASAYAAIGATSIAVTQFTANAAYAIGVAVNAYNTAAQFAGVAIREVKQATEYPAQGFPYTPGQPCDVIQRGNVTVVCAEGTPAVDGPVYVAVSAGTNVAPGDFCATATPAGGAATVQITNAQWAGTADANNVAELAVLTRNNA